MTARTCAICVGDIVGDVRMEPLGRNDALVACCERCVTRHVGTSKQHYDRVAAYRQTLIRDGYCANGRAHERPSSGQLCTSCRAKYRARDAKRRGT